MGLQEVLESARVRQKLLKKQLIKDLDGLQSCVLEIGCGHGDWLVNYAENHPKDYCVGIDLLNKRLIKTSRKKEKKALTNVALYKAEAKEFIDCLPSSLSLECTFLIYPDPWPKKRHHRRRLVQGPFLSKLAERTVPGGAFYFRSDHLPYFEWALEHLLNHKDWQVQKTKSWPYEHQTFFQKLNPQHYSLVAQRLSEKNAYFGT